MNLTLKLPRQQKRAWFRRPRVAEQRQWVENLPDDHPATVLRLINRRLRELNFTAMPGRHRIRCLAPFPRPLRELHEQLTEQLRDEHLPYPEALDTAMRELAESWARLAVGYLCTVRDRRRRDARLAGQAALGALRSLGRLIVARSQVYESVPPGTWRHIHECREMVRARRPEAADPAGDANDTETAYRQALILGATGLQRLRPAEQMSLFQVLGEWVRPLVVQRLRNVEPKGPPVVFRPGEDEAPRIYPLDQVPDAPGLRIIDPAPLAGRARQRLNRLESGENSRLLSGEYLAPDSLRALLAAWSGSPARRFPRSDNADSARISLGLESAWRTLAGDLDGGHRECRLTDRSATGFLAVIETPDPGSVHVGELVAVQDDGRWTLGVVRWLRLGGRECAHLGIEALSRRPSVTRVSVAGTEPVPVFLVEANRATDQPPTLVAPRWPRLDNTKISTVDGRMLTIHRCMESTQTFHRFRYETDAGSVH